MNTALENLRVDDYSEPLHKVVMRYCADSMTMDQCRNLEIAILTILLALVPAQAGKDGGNTCKILHWLKAVLDHRKDCREERPSADDDANNMLEDGYFSYIRDALLAAPSPQVDARVKAGEPQAVREVGEPFGWFARWNRKGHEFYEGWERPNAIDDDWNSHPDSLIPLYASRPAPEPAEGGVGGE